MTPFFPLLFTFHPKQNAHLLTHFYFILRFNAIFPLVTEFDRVDRFHIKLNESNKNKSNRTRAKKKRRKIDDVTERKKITEVELLRKGTLNEINERKKQN